MFWIEILATDVPTVVNGADDILRNAGGPIQIPTNRQGFGRVNVSSALEMIVGQTAPANAPAVPNAGFVDAGPDNTAFPALVYDQTADLNVIVPPRENVLVSPAVDLPHTLKVTLTWLDSPDALLQDRLAYFVRVLQPGGTATYVYGNSSNVLRPGNLSPAYFDNRNNVQQVCWEDITPGPVTIQVKYHTAVVQTRIVNNAIA